MERGNAAKIAAPAALPPAAPGHHRTAAVRASNGRHRGCLPSCCHCTEEPPIWQGLSAQQPDDAGGGALRRVVVVVARVQLKHRVDPLGLIERLDLLRILPDIPQDRVPGLALFVSQGEVDAVWLALGLVGKDVLLHAGKPEGAGHAAHPGKQIRPVDGVQGEQPGQGVPGDPTPAWDSANLFLCYWDDLLGQEPQVVVRAAGTGLGVFEGGRTVPGNHIVVPLQITDGHQSKWWAAYSLRRFKDIFLFVGECVEINNRCICFCS